MIAIDDQRPLGDGRRVSYAEWEQDGIATLGDSLGDDVIEVPDREQGRSNATNSGGDHVRNWRSDLDGHQARDAHEETENTLQGC